jgi:hypothetical protein
MTHDTGEQIGNEIGVFVEAEVGEDGMALSSEDRSQNH